MPKTKSLPGSLQNRRPRFEQNRKLPVKLHISASIFCDFFRKETCVFPSGGVKLALRKEKTFSSGKRLRFPEYDKKENTIMSNSNNNQINIPQAREAMDRFKMQAAQEVGVNLTNGYNGHLTSREAGSVGGQMVKNMCPGRTKKYEREIRTAMGHLQTVEYIAAIFV